MKPKAIFLVLLFCFSLLLTSSASAGEQLTHVVKRGDTLWGICEQYYGDPYLWPELWEMNKFVTNPHWLRPGDVITLLEYEEIKKIKERKAESAKKAMEREKPPLKKLTGIDVSGLTNTMALGSFRPEMIEPWGRIFDFKVDKILQGKGDTVYVRMYKGGVKPGDLFTIYTVSDPIEHPLSGEQFGHIHSFKGILEIEKPQEDYLTATIRESFRAIGKDDLVIPHDPVSPCVLPVSCPQPVTAYIVAAKDDRQVLGQFSVVYIDAGHNRGVRRGQLFEAIEERHSAPDSQKEQLVALPPDVLGKILILEAAENTSTGVVFSVSREFTRGVKLRPLTWQKDEEPSDLAMLPACPLE